MTTTNRTVLEWVEQAKELCRPAEVVWIDGSDAQADMLRQQALATGELHLLNREKLPGCVLHRSDPRDVARVEDRTFICSRSSDDCGPTNNWMDPKKAYPMLREIFSGCMQGRAMYIVPFVMGPLGSPNAKIGIEITDSIYVTLSMLIMTRAGTCALEALGDSDDWVRCMHSKAELDPEKRYICHFPEDNAIWSVNSGYGGNALMGKKCFALRIGSYLAKNEGWLAEHMLILGIENPQGETHYIAAAFPSACGKTNLAMLIPPEIYKKRGYRAWCVGDDIAWMHIGPDGRLYAINAEKGFFGVAPGTNAKSNPNALATTQRNTIFTNVALNTDDNTVWWEGLDKTPPAHSLDWCGNVWNGSPDRKGAHPNSRFTAPAENCPVLSPMFNDPQGVPIDAIVFGGRRARTAPLVYQARDWKHGVFVGSSMASETTAAIVGQVGVVRRDPMAMLPFCGYHMGDYWQHWLDMGERLGDKAPKIFNVNWFRTDDEGHFIWPGFGDNMRVVEWILGRAAGTADAVETPVGFEPRAEDINLEGLDITSDTVRELLHIDPELWREEVAGIRDFYKKFGEKLPSELTRQLDALEARLG